MNRRTFLKNTAALVTGALFTAAQAELISNQQSQIDLTGNNPPEIGPVLLPAFVGPPKLDQYSQCLAEISGTNPLCVRIQTPDDTSIHGASVPVTGTVRMQCNGINLVNPVTVSTVVSVTQTGGNSRWHCSDASFAFPPQLTPATGCEFTIVGVISPTVGVATGLQGATVTGTTYQSAIGEVSAQCF